MHLFFYTFLDFCIYFLQSAPRHFICTYVKAMVFPVVMYRCESWTVRQAERWRVDAFELWCWRRLLRVPWTERRSNQSIKRKSILYIYWKDWCWSWNSSTLATWCEELTHWKRPWCWERLKAEGEGDDRGWDGWMASLTQGAWVSVNSGSSWWTRRPVLLQFMVSQKVRLTERLNWTDTSRINPMKLYQKMTGLITYGDRSWIHDF